MGLDMIDTINHIKGSAYPFLNMRIGIHTVSKQNTKIILNKLNFIENKIT